VFVCENNQYAANNAVAVQHPITDVAVLAKGYGMPGVIVDGNDVLEVRKSSGEAVERARRGDGPTLVECKTYRWHFHAMRHAIPPETRPAEEVAHWKERDPVARLATDLIARRVMSESELGGLHTAVRVALEEAVAFADASPFPDPKDVLADMFA
jgi:TPP-dependent pyruvate/acetoin dehydrogenase alpha subunit